MDSWQWPLHATCRSHSECVGPRGLTTDARVVLMCRVLQFDYIPIPSWRDRMWRILIGIAVCTKSE